MISTRELSIALYGTWRFAALDRSAIQFFDNTPDAFWRSFYAALVALPAYALLVISYVIGWVLFPLVMVSFTDTLKCSEKYFRFIAAWNWSIVLQSFLFLGVSAFSASGAIPDNLGGLISLVATLAIFFYQGFIARTTLDVPVPAAALVVVIDLSIAIGLSLVGRSLYGAGA